MSIFACLTNCASQVYFDARNCVLPPKRAYLKFSEADLKDDNDSYEYSPPISYMDHDEEDFEDNPIPLREFVRLSSLEKCANDGLFPSVVMMLNAPELMTWKKVNHFFKNKIQSPLKLYLEYSYSDNTEKMISAKGFVEIFRTLSVQNFPSKLCLPLENWNQHWHHLKKIGVAEYDKPRKHHQYEKQWQDTLKTILTLYRKKSSRFPNLEKKITLLDTQDIPYSLFHEDLKFVCHSQLTCLKISRIKMGEEQIDFLIENAPQLTALHYTSTNEKEISSLHHLKSLKDLAIHHDKTYDWKIEAKKINIGIHQLESLGLLMQQLQKFTVDFEISNDQWKTLFNRKSQISELHLENNCIDQITLLHMAKSISAIQKLHIPDFTVIGSNEKFIISIQSLIQLCPQLCEIELRPFPLLEIKYFRQNQLKQACFKGYAADILNSLGEFFPNIAKLKYTVSYGEMLDLSAFPSLKDLELHSFASKPLCYIKQLTPVLPHLEKFKTDMDIHNEEYKEIFSHTANLREIDLGNTLDIDDETLSIMANRNPYLKKITIQNLKPYKAPLSLVISSMLLNCSELEQIHLSSSKNVLFNSQFRDEKKSIILKFTPKGDKSMRYVAIHYDPLIPIDKDQLIKTLSLFGATIIKAQVFPKMI